MTDRDTHVRLDDVLGVLDGYSAPSQSMSPISVVDALHEELAGLRARPVPDGGRLIVAELHGTDPGDLAYIEATRNLSSADAVRWAVRIAARELEQRERLARDMSAVMHVDLVDARRYIDGDRDLQATIARE